MFLFDALVSYVCDKRMGQTKLTLEQQIADLKTQLEEYKLYPVCHICEENPVNVVMKRCKHARICRDCWKKICKTSGRICPDCRTPNNSAMGIILPLKD